MPRKFLLLPALAARATTADSRLLSEQVRSLGARLGLSEAAIVDQIERLAKRGHVALRWGGAVELTPQGAAHGRSVLMWAIGMLGRLLGFAR